MNPNYEAWLRSEGYDEGTVAAQLYRADRVERYYGDLDKHFTVDGLATVITALLYTAEDNRQGRPNPSLIPFKGAVAGNMAGYRTAVRWYRRFCEEGIQPGGVGADVPDRPSSTLTPKQPRLTRSTEPSAVPVDNPVTLAHFNFDGFKALEALISGSLYKTLAQAVASLTVFSHPDTVRQTGGKSLFRTIRGPRTPGVYSELDGQRVMLDDNKSASDAFLWANQISRRGDDTQFNHIYSASRDVDAYTSLANICMTPAFMAKLTDTSPAICAVLKYRSFELYGWVPAGVEPPIRPNGYEERFG